MGTEQHSLLAALDPDFSVVVEACAGSGKTWLLVSRIVRLLLAGVAPSEILAITFTRKGAREMQQRLNAWLQKLATDPDDECVKNFLRERGIKNVDELLPQARGLYEKVLAARPGLKINTFHGWFADLLQRAPLQAGVAKGFALTEAVHALEQEAWQRYALSLAGSETSLRQAALDELFREYGLYNTRKLLANFLAKRAEWWSYTAGQKEPVKFAIAQLATQTKVDVDEDIAAALFRDGAFDSALTILVSVLEAGGKSLQKLLRTLSLAAFSTEPAERLAAMMPVIFTKEGPVRDALERCCAKSGAPAAEALAIVSEKMLTAHRSLIEQHMLRTNTSAFIAGHGLLEHYQQLKAERGLLDFTDVEYAAYSLLRHSDHAEYMQYKLDARYRHILLDEFQDTNPLQWMTLQAWLQASCDAGLRPTVFLVGDPKQSVFHFRRADARLFRHATEFLTREYGAHVLQQNESRRSCAGVLDAVNAVFASTRQLSGFAPHRAFDHKLEGAVHLLPLAQTAEGDAQPSSPEQGLRDLLTMPQSSVADLRRALEAGDVARGIAAMVGGCQVQEGGRRRPAEYSDVMILTRRRKPLRDYEFALRAAGIPYASARQGGLLDSLEAHDLMALLQFLLRPSDDLSLVHALRAPLFSCSDEDLIALAQTPGVSWWQRLNAVATKGSPALMRAHTCLARWLQQAPHLPVHDLLDRIFFESDLEWRYRLAVPKAMLRLVQANLIEFMELSLTLDSGRYPSLGRFLAELKVLQRAPDVEAPIVWIIDATTKPKSHEPYDVLVTWPTGAERPQHFSFLST
ncbi:MAG: UvrD-helicase domain-containing protein, partial [Burkholderiales bacterium]